jgi:hypothetical protein
MDKKFVQLWQDNRCCHSLADVWGFYLWSRYMVMSHKIGCPKYKNWRKA